MKIFIDFDDTLINRTQLMQDFYASFDGVSPQAMKETYDRFRSHQAFDLAAFAAEVELMHGIPEQKVVSTLQTLQGRTHAYRFNESRAFLQELKRRGHKIFLVTFAEDTTWQMGKIDGSGLRDLFDEICITQQSKHEALRAFSPTEPFCFIDDSGREVESVQKAFPHAKCFLKLHDNGKSDGFADRLTSVQSLKEILSHLV